MSRLLSTRGGDGPSDDFGIVRDYELGMDRIQINVATTADNIGGIANDPNLGAAVLFSDSSLSDLIAVFIGVSWSEIANSAGGLENVFIVVG